MLALNTGNWAGLPVCRTNIGLLARVACVAVAVMTGALPSVAQTLSATAVPDAAPLPQRADASIATLVFLGADPDEGVPGQVSQQLTRMAFPGIPGETDVATDVLAALLRASPVSTFATSGEAAEGGGVDLHLVADLVLSGDAAAPTVAIGGETMTFDALGQRLAALIAVLSPGARQTAYIRIDDAGDLLPAVLPPLRRTLADLGFAVTSVAVRTTSPACDGPRQALYYDILAGVPDRAPFGGDDGAVSVDEAVIYLQGALARDRARATACAADYSLILAGPDITGTVATVAAGPLIPDLDQAVSLEIFEALFLMSSSDAVAIETYLADCQYCPSETGLIARLRNLGEIERTRVLESSVWSTIAADAAPDRIAIYLQNCTLCSYRAEAETRLAEFDAADTARAAEDRARERLVAADDLAGLIEWRASCAACDGADAVDEKIAALQADDRVAAEAAALESAMTARDPALIADWLADCDLCAQKSDAESAMVTFAAETAAVAPCVAQSGLPQMGGPRLLTDIDVAAATAACDAALAIAPENPLVRVLQGRIALAKGDGDAAAEAYGVGMQAGLSQAFGLAAHNFYAPVGGGDPDYPQAESLALRGYETGDWLSGEVLVVLYSREFIPGKYASDAYAIALAHAEAGNPVAQFFVGFFLRTGTGVTPDDAAAARWLETALGQGYMHASAYLAEIYETGADGITADPEKATEIYFAGLDARDPTVLDRLTNQIEDRPQAVVQAVQTRLREAGMFRSSVDGIPGPATARAVDVYFNRSLDAG